MSQETIYRFVWRHKRDGGDRSALLRHCAKKRRKGCGKNDFKGPDPRQGGHLRAPGHRRGARPLWRGGRAHRGRVRPSGRPRDAQPIRIELKLGRTPDTNIAYTSVRRDVFSKFLDLPPIRDLVEIRVDESIRKQTPSFRSKVRDFTALPRMNGAEGDKPVIE